MTRQLSSGAAESGLRAYAPRAISDDSASTADGFVTHDLSSLVGTVPVWHPVSVSSAPAVVAASPDMASEVAFISGVDSAGHDVAQSYWTWSGGAANSFTSDADTHKWGGLTAGSAGGTVHYYFADASHWSASEQAVFTASMALWSDIANVQFAPASSAAGAQITFERGAHGTGAFDTGSWSGGGGNVGSGVLSTIKSMTISIDTTEPGFGPINGSFASFGGYVWETVLHELGHAIGLGHAGAYNDSGAPNYNPDPGQFSAYDTRLWSIMSYINPSDSAVPFFAQYPVAGASFGTTTVGTTTNPNVPTTVMQLDILAAQALYGAPSTTAFSGGQIFGFHCNIADATEPFYDFKINTNPVVTIWDSGTGNTLDLSGFKSAATIDLNSGSFSSCNNETDNIGIAAGTKIDSAVASNGLDTIIANDDVDHLLGGNGNDTFILGASMTSADTIDGGKGLNTLKLDGDYSKTLKLTSHTLTDVNNIALAAGHSYSFLSSDATFVKATGAVNGTLLGVHDQLRFDGHLESESHLALSGGAGNDTLTGGTAKDFLSGNGGNDTLSGGDGNDEIGGGLGADHLSGGTGADMFDYASAGESTSTGYDTITDFDASQDTLDVFFDHAKLAAVQSPILSGSLSKAHFDDGIAKAVADLGVHDAQLFTPTKGNLAGITFLVVDFNGVAGYQAGEDLVIALTHPANMAAFGAGNFVEK